MLKRLGIYFVVDMKYLLVARVQAINLINKTGLDVHIFIENGDGIPSENPQHQKMYFHYNQLRKYLPSGLPSSDKWPEIVYLRIFVPQILKEYDKLLYIDADVHLNGKNIDYLVDLDMGNSALAAVHDTGMVGPVAPGLEIPTEQWLKNLGLRGRRYFNSGVLLINVVNWVSLDFETLLINYFRDFAQHVRMWDQDFLNFVFQEKWIELSPRYNFQISIFNMGFDEFFDPILVHFTDGRKPWHWETFDWAAKYVLAYQGLAKNAGVPLGEFPKPNYYNKKIKFHKIKIWLRKYCVKIGVITRKHRERLVNYNSNRNGYIKFFEDCLNNGHFKDMLDLKTFDSSRNNVVFNGRIMINSDN